MPQVELSAGVIEYQDTGGTGPVLVLLHGLLMDGTVWRHVVAELGASHRCIVPTLPLGSHREPMRPDADLSMRGIAELVGALIDKLGLHDITLVLNDWGGAILLVTASPAERIKRLVITSCEAFDNVPPGLAARMAVMAAWVPGGLTVAMQQLRLRFMRRSALVFGEMSKRPIRPDVMDAWFRPVLADCGVRRDLKKYLRNAKEAKRDLMEATERLRAFERPTLIAWASEDRLMPPDHGRRLAALMPRARLVEIKDSYTLIPEDQPVALASALSQFIAET